MSNDSVRGARGPAQSKPAPLKTKGMRHPKIVPQFHGSATRQLLLPQICGPLLASGRAPEYPEPDQEQEKEDHQD